MHMDLRLKAIADMVDCSDILADIGTDHGKIPVYLMQKGTIKSAIATDISRQSLSKAEQLAKLNKLDIDTRLGDGLSVLKQNEADFIVIAGMGGILIRDILDKGGTVSLSSTLILQPMRDDKLLRKYLMTNSYRIIDENIAKKQDKIYPIIKARYRKHSVYNEPKCDDLIYDIGPVLIEKRSEFFNEYLSKKIASYEIKLKHNDSKELALYIESLKKYTTN